jgi:hypothetical protein
MPVTQPSADGSCQLALKRLPQAIERDKRDTLVRTLRKSAAVLRAEFMDEKNVEALFPSIQEAKVLEEEPTSAAATA